MLRSLLPFTILCLASEASAVEPHRSQPFLASANGRASLAYDAKAGKLVQMLEHPYRHRSANAETRDFLFDAYPGLRVGNQRAWLTSVAPSAIEYVKGTGVVHVVRSVAGVVVDEYDFAPAGLAENAAFTLVKVTRTSGAGPIDVYHLANFHLGAGAPEPSASGEGMSWASSRDAFYEWGQSGVAMAHGSVVASSFHGATPNNPYFRLLQGADLANDAGPGSVNDAVCGFQQSLGDLAQNQSAWAGWYSVLAPDNDAQPAADRVRAFIGGRAPEKILQDEIDGWGAWLTPIPASGREGDLARAQQVMLRMGQVSEPGKSDGQILASVAPGKWNISWVRDMAYAIVALARTNHGSEAKRALAFQLGADAGKYQQYVGAPYQISVVRYYGDGSEETDFNQDGPNIEFDGFGLFLWALEEYARASKDTTSITQWWPAVSTKIADALVSLQDSKTGIIAPDSSIWEVHWNGKQQRFAYTTITAAAGLCAAARLAKLAGDAALEKKYLDAGKLARDGLFAYMRAPDGSMASSIEQLAKGSGFLDAASIEAVGMGLVRPDGRTAFATASAIRAGLVPPSGRGFKRNQAGGWYDEQEWVFVDLRAARAMSAIGLADPTFGWNVDQGAENFGILSELHDAVSADYVGEAPMVGFGAGAYLLALLGKNEPITPACGEFASEPPLPRPTDAGAPPLRDDAGNAPAEDAGPGGGLGIDRPSAGCSCNQSSGGGAPLLTLLVLLVLRSRRATVCWRGR